MAERINAVKTSFFGKGAIRLLGPELQKMGIRRALLVTDRFLYDSGAAARVDSHARGLVDNDDVFVLVQNFNRNFHGVYACWWKLRQRHFHNVAAFQNALF